MNSIFKLMKRNKLTTMIIIIYIVFIFILGIVMNRFFAKNGQPIYGDRLKEVEKFPINEDNKRKEIEKDLLASGKISSVEFQVRGRTLNCVTKYFKAEELNVYSIEVLVMKDDTNAKDFPINATKQYGRENFSWTKDR